MSPTSYQAAPPRVRGRHYRGEPPGCQRTETREGRCRLPTRRAPSARRRRCRAGLRFLEQEQDLAGATQAELLAGDLLDAVGIVAEVADVARQAVVALSQRPDFLLQAGNEVPLAVSLDEPHVPEQGVEQERQCDEPEQHEKRLATQIDRRGLGREAHRRRPLK